MTTLRIRIARIRGNLVRVRTRTANHKTSRYARQLPDGPGRVLRLLAIHEPVYDHDGLTVYVAGGPERTRLIIVKEIDHPPPAA